MRIVSHNTIEAGLFGAVIAYILQVLPWIEEFRPDEPVSWDISTQFYGNIFPDVLVSNTESVSDETIDLCDLKNETLYPQYIIGDDFLQINKLFTKYFSIPQDIMTYVDTQDFTNTLGLHYRGTDKLSDTEMNTPISGIDFLNIVDKYLKTRNFSRIFLATDDSNVFKRLKTKYPTKVFSSRIVQTDLFWQKTANPTSNAKCAMVDALCLSRCTVVLKTSSALSAFSKIINPELEIYRINASRQLETDNPYFPDAYIPLLRMDGIQRFQADDWSFKYREKFREFFYRKIENRI